MEQYISKSALLTEIEKLRDELQEKVETSDFIKGEVFIMNYFISFLDFIEAKEVDLEKELNIYLEKVKKTDEDIIFGDFARHFFELGMQVSKAQKGEEV